VLHLINLRSYELFLVTHLEVEVDTAHTKSKGHIWSSCDRNRFWHRQYVFVNMQSESRSTPA